MELNLVQCDRRLQEENEADTIKRILQEDVGWCRDLVDYSHDLLCIHNLQGHILSLNPGPARLLGYSVDEIMKIPMRELIAPEYRAGFDAYLDEIQRNGQASGLLVLMTRSGERHIWQYHNTLRTEGVPSPVVRGLAHDVTEQKRVARKLRHRESDLRRAQSVGHIGTWHYAFGDNSLYLSDEACNILGLPVGSSPGPDTLLQIGDPEDESLVRGAWSTALATGRHELESRISAAGKFRWIHTIAEVEYDGEGRASTAIGTIRDITESKRIEAALRAGEAHFRLLIEQASDGIFLSDAQGRYLEVNSAGAEMLGYSKEEILQLSIADVVAPAEVARIESEVARLAGGNAVRAEWIFRRKDGSLFSGEVSARQLPDGRLQAILRDVSERKRMEQAITTLGTQVRSNSSATFFSSMANNLARCLGADHTIIGELVGSEDEAVRTVGVCSHGRELENFTYDLANSPCAGVMNQGLCSYTSAIAQLFPKDALLSQMKVEAYIGMPLFGAQGRPIGIVAALYDHPLENATFGEMILHLFSDRIAAEIERRRAEQTLLQSEERFRVALKESPITVCNQDRDLRYTWVYNPCVGWAEQDIIGKTDAEMFEREEASRLTEIKKAVLQSGVGVREELPISEAGKQHYFDFTIEPLFDRNGSVTGLTCAAADVTHLREINEELQAAKEKLTEENVYLEQEINAGQGFGEVVGTSGALKSVMKKVTQVASIDSTVLVLGETGTGKELIARAVHRMSKRKDRAFIKMNCAAIPSGLLESELFGHEKGAFTGAVARKIGRLELADKGTLFLDEIGEIPLALQPKLLRVLQDQEFERLGSNQTLKVNFRLIAATNQDLFQNVQENRFRGDLYYRLNVFPIRMPPLRERRSDIPLLVEHFVRKHAQRMNKPITSIPRKVMDAFVNWGWPGNVRELENFVERSVILTHNSALAAPINELLAEVSDPEDSLEVVEREHILRVLKENKGRVSGTAVRLGLPRTTLQSKLKQMGIDHRQYRSG